MRTELNARFDDEERAALKRFAREHGVSEAAALRMLVRRLIAAEDRADLARLEPILREYAAHPENAISSAEVKRQLGMSQKRKARSKRTK